jgi:hypothetical protein
MDSVRVSQWVFLEWSERSGVDRTTTGIIPNPDSIAEFRIISSNVAAEYGGHSGGVINIGSPMFGHVLKAAPPRIAQIALKLTF